ncbi:DUF3352 domain-containing protein [Rapidithrix thailandica]|uniref:DUF3352 domain-containing protein n=1 Tax=Rapidithrix thailandica TaxID=413964 RepID=A0AAW9SHP0_9BACT
MKKYVIWGLSLGLAGILLYGVFVWFIQPSDSFQPLYLIPEDAVFVIETNEPINNWEKISSSKAWQHLKRNDYFAELTESVDGLDSLIQENATVFSMLGSRSVWISAHMYRNDAYDFLYVVDLQKASKLKLLKNYISTFLGSDFKVTQREYHGQELTEITDKATNETLFLTFIDNLLVLSYTHSLVEASINQLKEPQLGRDLQFLDVYKEVSGKDMFRFYISYPYLKDYMSLYTEGSEEYLESISQQLKFSGLSFDLKDDHILKMEGATNLNDSLDTYLLAMLQSGTGKTNAVEVAPIRTAFYMGLSFDNFEDFYEKFQQIAQHSVEDYEEYQKNIEKVERFLDINLKEHFISWIDNEIAFIQTQPSGLGKDNEFAVVLQAHNGDEAKENLDFVAEKIRKKTPVKFKAVKYKGHDINFISVKGFFRLILGKFFEKLEKPYYTIIDSYVIFSNHPQTLRGIIDDYTEKNTLAESKQFNDFYDEFNDDSNVFLYVQTPVLHPNLKSLVSNETWTSLKKNRDYIVCFSDIGFQLTGRGRYFETRINSSYSDLDAILQQEKEATLRLANKKHEPIILVQLGDTSVEANDAFSMIAPEQIEEEELIPIEEISLDDLDARKHKEFHEDGTLKVEVPIKDGMKNGTYREYYSNGELKIKGKFKNDQRTGLWKMYNEEGKTIEKQRY